LQQGARAEEAKRIGASPRITWGYAAECSALSYQQIQTEPLTKFSETCGGGK
jgi:hypothetical protein